MTTELKELFSFLNSDRPDVRKMATAGLAQVSKDNKELFHFIADEENKPFIQRFAELLDPRLPKEIVQTLADVLLATVNISVDNSCCDTLVALSIPLKLIKTYETLQVKGDEIENTPVLCELTLMALNNLTSTSVAACRQVLELDDEDLAGYHFGRLKVHYDRAPDFLANNNNNDDDEKDETKKKNTTSQASQRKWLLQVALNVSRTQDGTKIFMEDDDWLSVVGELISHPIGYIRGLGMQLVRNLANYRDISHEKLVDEVKVTSKIMYQISHQENDLTMLHGWIDVLVALIVSEPGMRGMDSINAKKVLDVLVEESKIQRIADTKKVEELNDDGTKKQDTALKRLTERSQILPWEVAKRIEEEVLPYLDDIQEIYVNEQE